MQDAGDPEKPRDPSNQHPGKLENGIDGTYDRTSGRHR